MALPRKTIQEQVENKHSIIIDDREVTIDYSITYSKTNKVAMIDMETLLILMTRVNKYRSNSQLDYNNFIQYTAKRISNCTNKEEYESLLHTLMFDMKVDNAIISNDLSAFEIK